MTSIGTMIGIILFIIGGLGLLTFVIISIVAYLLKKKAIGSAARIFSILSLVILIVGIGVMEFTSEGYWDEAKNSDTLGDRPRDGVIEGLARAERELEKQATNSEKADFYYELESDEWDNAPERFVSDDEYFVYVMDWFEQLGLTLYMENGRFFIDDVFTSEMYESSSPLTEYVLSINLNGFFEDLTEEEQIQLLQSIDFVGDINSIDDEYFSIASLVFYSEDSVFERTFSGLERNGERIY